MSIWEVFDPLVEAIKTARDLINEALAEARHAH